MVKRMKKYTSIIENRILFLEILVGFFFLILFFSLYRTIYQNRVYYEKKLKELTQVIVEGESAPRGRIYDRNYKLLVDNISVPVIYYQKEKRITPKEEIELAYKIGEHLSIDTSKLHIRNLKEFYLIQYPEIGNKKITKEEYEKLKRRELTTKEIEELKISRISEEELSTYQEKDLEAAYLYYLMNQGYSYEEKILKNEGVTDEEFSYFSENLDSYRGVNTKVTWQRKYLYGDTLRTILGNIGPITKEMKQTYISKG